MTDFFQMLIGFAFVAFTAVLLYFLVLAQNKKAKAREAYLRSLLANQSNFLIRITRNGDLTYVNRALSGLLKKRGVIGKSFKEVVIKRDQSKFLESVKSCLTRSGKTVAVTLTINIGGNHELLTEWEFTSLKYENGEGPEIQGVGHRVSERQRALMQARAYMEKLETILSNTGNVLWSLRADNLKPLFVSNSCTKLYGYEPLDFYEFDGLWMEMIHKEDRQKVREQLNSLPAKGPIDLEFRIRRRDGSIHRLYVEFHFVQATEGGVATINGLARNITNVKTKEARPEKPASRVMEMLESLGDGFFALDNAWNFIFVNEAFENHMQVKREAVLGKGMLDAFPWMIDTKFFGVFQDAVQQRAKASIEEHFAALGKWLKLSIYPGKKGISIYLQDVGHEGRLAELSTTDQHQINTLINSTTDLIWSVDRDCRLVSANNAFLEKMKRDSGADLHPGDAIFTQTKSDKLKWDNYFKRALAGESFRLEDVSLDAEGHEQEAEISFNPIREQGKVIGVACFSHQVTERKAIEARLEEQNKKLREIAFVHSQVLRQPVATILGLISLFDKSNYGNEINATVLEKLQVIGAELDAVIKKIVKKTSELDEGNGDKTK